MVKSLPARNEEYVVNKVIATWRRIWEDRTVHPHEAAEFEEVLGGNRGFAGVLVSGQTVKQAVDRSDDPEYVGNLVAIHQMRMSRLPDVA
jgi:hypothetical protein